MRFSTSKSEQTITALEDTLNRSLWSFQTSSPPAAIPGNVGTSSASVVLSKHDISRTLSFFVVIQRCDIKKKMRCVSFRMGHKWILNSIHRIITLILVQIISLALSLSTGEGAVRVLCHRPAVLIRTISYFLVIAISILLRVKRPRWKICAEDDDRQFICRFLSSDHVLYVNQYKRDKLERKEAKMLPFFQDHHIFGIENQRYAVLCSTGKSRGQLIYSPHRRFI